MGQEIASSQFSERDFQIFRQRLANETRLLEQWWRQERFDQSPSPIGGYEIEAWLVDSKGFPVARNKELIDKAGDLLLFPELSRFNIELNSEPRVLQGDVLDHMARELENTWGQSRVLARGMDCHLMMIGTLPTVQEHQLTLDNISDMQRYRALNQQVLRMREGRPLELDIQGEKDHLRASHRDVMLESATTSFQIHLQVPASKVARYYNVSLVLSAPMVAVSANSPWLFGHQLWDETRIPLFEQSVAVPVSESCAHGELSRVGFGSGYAGEDLLSCFSENENCFPALLPIEVDKYPSSLGHLRLHNGTIWRWNRPLVGFSENGDPHMRIEHRVMSAGPSVADTIANAAFYYGTATALAEAGRDPAEDLSFSLARDNFYAAAKFGLGAQLTWLDGQSVAVRDLILDELLPQAERGLQMLGVAPASAKRHLDVIRGRVTSSMNGAAWQKACVEACDLDMASLTLAYLKWQDSGRPVHEWDVKRP